MKFYYPDGEEIYTVKEFIDFYSKAYFYVSRNIKLENHIVDILKRDKKLDIEDYKDILLWKTGGTIEKDAIEISYRGKTINPTKVMSVCSRIDGKEDIDLKKTIEELKKIDGVGNVIAITIIYFVTKGVKYPIYDKFAHTALIKINREDEFDTLVNDKELSKEFRDGDNLDAVIADYNNYIEMVSEMEHDWKGPIRSTDRALWMYGHLFNYVKSNQSREKLKFV